VYNRTIVRNIPEDDIRIHELQDVSGIVLAGGSGTELRLPPIVMQQQRVQGDTVGSVDDLRGMVPAVSNSEMHQVMDRIFALEDAGAAFEHMASGKHVGKVAIPVQ